MNDAAMQVVHVTSAHPPDDTRIFYRECRSLAQRGLDVTLVAPGKGTWSQQGVRVVGVRRPRSKLGRIIGGALLATLQAFRLRADLYHLHDPELLPWAFLLRLRAPVVFDMHENLPAAIRSKGWIADRLRSPISTLARAAERLLLWRSPVVFAERSYVPAYPFVRRSCVVLNLPDLAFFPNPLAERRAGGTFRLGYLGGLTEQRGAWIMLDATRELQRRGHDVGLTAIGPVYPPSLEAELRHHVREHGIENIELRGFTPLPEAIRRLDQCHVGVALLQPSPNYLESYPTKVFEYMALGLPVACSDFPLYRDLMEETGAGVSVDATDPHAVADAIEPLVIDRDMARDLGRKGREAVESTYNWSTEVNRLYEFYHRIAAR